ncbi:MAG: hypothetical protein OHK0029_09510 [Armatimonadaceae bacterium]
MNKASLLASAALATLAFASAPVFAQGPFADVPSDHWAYEAVDKLQKRGIVIGYPDGTYGGKRSMTRYEFAIAIARLLDVVGTATEGGNTTVVQPPDLSRYALKSDLDRYALKSDLERYARPEDIATLRRMIDEFKAELLGIGVDLDAIKKRLDDLERRVSAIEEELKRVRISGAVNVYTRANQRFGSDIENLGLFPGGVPANRETQSVRDTNGYEVTGGAGQKGSLLADTRVFHDVDVNLDARISENAMAKVTLNFGNYLSFLNTLGSFTGFRSDRALGGERTQFVNQDQSQTIYQAYIDTGISTPILGRTGIQVGRIPFQLTPYTFKLMDVDYYFENDKTDLGNVPVDGLNAKFNLGPVGVNLFAAKTDPIRFLSNVGGNIPGQGAGGFFAGAGRTAYGSFGGFRGGFLPMTAPDGTNFLTGNLPVGSPINPANNGAMSVEQFGGGRVELNLNRFGSIGATYIALSGAASVAPQDLSGTSGLTREILDDASFNRVYVYGADFTSNILFGLGLNASYTVSDTAGERLNANGTVDTSSETKIDSENDAYDISLDKQFGSLYLKGGYRYVGAFFAAPGYWTRVGNLFNPVDIKGFYGAAKLGINSRTNLAVEGQFYEGTGDAVERGGLTEDDRINNIRGVLNLGLSSRSVLGLGVEYTEYEVLTQNLTGDREKPRQIWYEVGYGYTFNPNMSARFAYQFIDWDDKNVGFDTINGDGGVATAQFRVKF